MIPVRDRLPTRSLPVVNYLLLATSIPVFLLEQSVITGPRSAHLLLQDHERFRGFRPSGPRPSTESGRSPWGG
ncbi:MAG: hypothetical protein ABJE95_00200 [Byssovorax sp.]